MPNWAVISASAAAQPLNVSPLNVSLRNGCSGRAIYSNPVANREVAQDHVPPRRTQPVKRLAALVASFKASI